MDANDAGGRNSEHCTLILTEGDSAKSLVVAGLSVGGRDRFGVFPLRFVAPVWQVLWRKETYFPSTSGPGQYCGLLPS